MRALSSICSKSSGGVCTNSYSNTSIVLPCAKIYHPLQSAEHRRRRVNLLAPPAYPLRSLPVCSLRSLLCGSPLHSPSAYPIRSLPVCSLRSLLCGSPLRSPSAYPIRSLLCGSPLRSLPVYLLRSHRPTLYVCCCAAAFCVISRCLSASYSKTAAAADAFNDVIRPRIGICTT